MNFPLLRLGVIGLGAIAQLRHLPALARHPRWRIVAAADLDPHTAALAASAFALPTPASDPRVVIENPEVDAVAVLTPPATHVPLARAALAAGKHVFVEKPLALDLDEARELAACAEHADARVLVGFNLRQHAHLQAARAQVRSGALGAVHSMHTTLTNNRGGAPGGTRPSWRADAMAGGDLLFELGVHHFDLWRFLLDAEPVELTAMEAHARGCTTVTVLARLKSGVLVTTVLGEDTLEHNSVELFGERGRLLVSLYRFDGLTFIPRGAYDGSLGVRLAHAAHTARSVSRLRGANAYVATYRAEWDHFSDVIRAGVPPQATLNDGVAATRLALAARESLRHNGPVPLL